LYGSCTNSKKTLLMKQIILFSLLLISTLISAQRGGSSDYTIKGQVVEAGSNQSIDYATVTVFDKASQKIQSGTTTENGGKFTLTSKSRDVYVEVSFLGYTTKRIDDISFEGRMIDLGTIKLGEDSQQLDEVVVTAEKSTTEFKLYYRSKCIRSTQ